MIFGKLVELRGGIVQGFDGRFGAHFASFKDLLTNEID